MHRPATIRQRLAGGVTAGLLLTLSACGGDTIAAGPESTPHQPPASAPEAMCPEPEFSPSHGVTELPGGVVGVRLCALDLDAKAPADELVTGSDRLVAQFNGAERFPAAEILCTADAGPAYAMVFRYPDRDPVTVTSMMGGCREVGGRFGGQELLATFVELLNAQRAATPPAPVPPGQACEGPALSWIPVRLDDLTTLSACERQPDGSLLTRSVASAEQWAVLKPDLLANVAPAEASTDSGPERILLATDQLGQPLQLRWIADSVTIWEAGPGLRSGRSLEWRPSPESRALLESLAS
ncbi:hypothetical protein [Granulicoccus sp. GXG6511]|uniref:hypothetical protein n=1 Tax=Granulicoccus sp. GXG6511 TaxID=3381351 RepID=UPI003D7D1647